jgi:hypothetical protein
VVATAPVKPAPAPPPPAPVQPTPPPTPAKPTHKHEHPTGKAVAVRAPEPEPAKLGSLKVKVSPWSDAVYVDEQNRGAGRAPLLIDLAAGRHTVRAVQFANRKEAKGTVEVLPGRVVVVRVNVVDGSVTAEP